MYKEWFLEKIYDLKYITYLTCSKLVMAVRKTRNNQSLLRLLRRWISSGHNPTQRQACLGLCPLLLVGLDCYFMVSCEKLASLLVSSHAVFMFFQLRNPLQNIHDYFAVSCGIHITLHKIRIILDPSILLPFL